MEATLAACDERFGKVDMETPEEAWTRLCPAPRRAGEMSIPPDAWTPEDRSQLPWYIYDRHANLLRIATTLADAEAWAFAHWDVETVGDREEVHADDYFYLLLARTDEAAFHTRDYQARIMRQDRVTAIGRDPQTRPRYSV
jgi:hypothetical protein